MNADVLSANPSLLMGGTSSPESPGAMSKKKIDVKDATGLRPSRVNLSTTQNDRVVETNGARGALSAGKPSCLRKIFAGLIAVVAAPILLALSLVVAPVLAIAAFASGPSRNAAGNPKEDHIAHHPLVRRLSGRYLDSTLSHPMGAGKLITESALPLHAFLMTFHTTGNIYNFLAGKPPNLND